MTVQELIGRLECIEDKTSEVLMAPDDSTLLGIRRLWTDTVAKTVTIVKE